MTHNSSRPPTCPCGPAPSCRSAGTKHRASTTARSSAARRRAERPRLLASGPRRARARGLRRGDCHCRCPVVCSGAAHGGDSDRPSLQAVAGGRRRRTGSAAIGDYPRLGRPQSSARCNVARRIGARGRVTRRDRRQSVRRLVERVAKWAGDEADKAARQRSLTTSPRGSPR